MCQGKDFKMSSERYGKFLKSKHDAVIRVADSYAQNRFRGTTEGKESSKKGITVIQK